MKIRNGFVSNSSSSSFIFDFNELPSPEFFKREFFDNQDYVELTDGYTDPQVYPTKTIIETLFSNIKVYSKDDPAMLDNLFFYFEDDYELWEEAERLYGKSHLIEDEEENQKVEDEVYKYIHKKAKENFNEFLKNTKKYIIEITISDHINLGYLLEQNEDLHSRALKVFNNH